MTGKIRIPLLLLVTLLSSGSLPSPGFAEENVTSPAVQPDRLAAITEVRKDIAAYYVFPNKRRQLLNAIDAAQHRGALNGPSATEFADQLTQVMQDAVDDKHLRLVYDPAWVTSFEIDKDTDRSSEFDQEATDDNYGIQKLERFPGNIRYVRITGFGWVNDRTGQAYDDVMRFLRDGAAIIIDIRGNSGGDHSAVRYLVSHFLKADTKLYDFTSTRDPDWQSYALSNLPAGRISGIPLYLLIDSHTISAGEDLAYQFQQYHLGELVGANTAGGANNNAYFPVAGNFRLSLSVGRPVHPVSQSNWEGVGVAPTLPTLSRNALDRAILAAANQLDTDIHATALQHAEYAWVRDIANAHLAPIRYKLGDLRALQGQYSDYSVVLQDGRLWLARGSGEPVKLVPMHEQGLFALEDRDYVRVKFSRGALELLALGAPEPRRYGKKP